MKNVLLNKYGIVQKLMEDSQIDAFTKKHIKIVDQALTSELLTYKQQSLDEVFFKRSSDRFFNYEKSVNYDDLIKILKTSAQFYQKNWPEDFHNQIAIDQYILVERIDHTNVPTDQFLKYNHSTEKLVPVGNKIMVHKEELVLQREFAKAAVIILYVCNLEDILERFGERGYQLMLKRAGSMAEFAWLHTVGLEYTGTVFAGTLPRALTTITDVDGYRKSQLFAFAFGCPIHKST